MAPEPQRSVYVVDLAKSVGHAMERVSTEGYVCTICGTWVSNGLFMGAPLLFSECRSRAPGEFQC